MSFFPKQEPIPTTTITTNNDEPVTTTTTKNNDDIDVIDLGDDDVDTIENLNEEPTTTTNSFLDNLKEEVILQTLLLKRVYEKKERVFELKHRNGR